jgi:hypothetical protein
MVGKTESKQGWAVVEGDDITYFHEQGDDSDFCPRAAAEDHAFMVGGQVVQVTVESRITAVLLVEDYSKEYDEEGED